MQLYWLDTQSAALPPHSYGLFLESFSLVLFKLVVPNKTIGPTPKGLFTPPYNFHALYPMEVEFKMIWYVPTVDLAIFAVNNQSTVSVEDSPSFEDSVCWQLGFLLKFSFALAGPALQLATATLSVAQTIANLIA